MFDKTKFKAASFDVDGTIFHGGEVSPRVAEAIRRLDSLGFMAFIATGRHRESLPECVLDIGCFSYAITSDGAEVIELGTNKVLAKSLMEKSTAIEVVSYIVEHTDKLHIAFEDEVIITGPSMRRLEKMIKTERERATGKRKEYTHTVVDDIVKALYGRDKMILKLGCSFENEESCQEFKKSLTEKFAVEAASTMGTDLEITSKGINKGWGLTQLCRFLGIHTSEVVSFGDGGNDIEIMHKAGFAVTLENATNEVKAVADYIAAHVEEDGVAEAIDLLFE